MILLANGASGAPRATTRRSPQRSHEVCADLARQVVADGEGVTVLAEINVTGAVDDAQAKAIARRIATSPLVKTALFGHDANWGRVLAAAGSAPFNGGYARRRPEPRHARLQRHDRARRAARRPASSPTLDGADVHDRARPRPRRRAARSYLTSDLSYDYVRINADYRT